MMAPISPAEPAFDAGGIPYSSRFGDVYHSADGAIGQAAHVFMGGNDLPRRWQGRPEFTIVETGFGLGLNFLATWAVWRADARRPNRLHFVSVEKHPFRPDDLRRMYATLTQRSDLQASELAPLMTRLAQAWPEPLPGLHRLHLEPGLTLTVAFGDLLDILPDLRAGADAFYLDGFSPAKNPEMWTSRVFKALARLARPDATLATYTAAGDVRRGLTDAGFVMEKRPGYGRKRTMLAGRFAPRWKVRRHEPPSAACWPLRHALVIGGGMGGAAMSHRLATRGWQVTLLEAGDAPARESSGNPLGIAHPQLSRDDNVLARLTRAGFLYSLAHWHALAAQSAAAADPRATLRWTACGVLQTCVNDSDVAEWVAWLDNQRYPQNYVRAVDAQTASALTGVTVPHGGLWFKQGGWVDPASLCRAQIADAGPALRVVCGAPVSALDFDGDLWHARDADGRAFASAPVAVVANASGALPLLAPYLDTAALPLKRVRGQLSFIPHGSLAPLDALRAVVCGDGYAAPALDGQTLVGATYDFDDNDPDVRPDGHRSNLARLAALLPSIAQDGLQQIDPRSLNGRTAFRCIAPDRLPMIGGLPDMAAIQTHRQILAGAHLRDLPRLPGLYTSLAFGSRGLVWAALAAELVASQIEGEPLPLEASLADAVDPARYVLRALRKSAA